MYHITNNNYTKLAEELYQELDESDYFSGVIEYEDDEIYIKVVLSIIIYRNVSRYLRDRERSIIKILPVWWEAKCENEEGEVESDFDFNFFSNIIYKCEYQAVH